MRLSARQETGATCTKVGGGTGKRRAGAGAGAECDGYGLGSGRECGVVLSSGRVGYNKLALVELGFGRFGRLAWSLGLVVLGF
jgi:hypothetical protein